QKNNHSYWQEFDFTYDKLLQGARSQKVQSPLDLSTLQTLALVQKVLEVETARSATTHEATRQLLAATNILPRNMASAQWLQYGISSFFETPRHSFYPSTALESWSNLIDFKYFRKNKKLSEGQSAEILLRTITDRYFNQAMTALNRLADKKEDYEELEKLALEKQELAQSTAWALTFYLMNNKLDQMFLYFEELKKLPPDMEYEPRILAGCFARAFGLGGMDSSDPSSFNMARIREMSNEWFARMDNTLLEIRSVETQVLQERADEAARKITPPTQTRPGQPGGYPGMPGYPGAGGGGGYTPGGGGFPGRPGGGR
ncbi:MAG: DUF1570 domain-containing protein, partial [Bdellovibrionales bacterium]